MNTLSKFQKKTVDSFNVVFVVHIIRSYRILTLNIVKRDTVKWGRKDPHNTKTEFTHIHRTNIEETETDTDNAA